MNCPRCDARMAIIRDENLGQTLQCQKCRVEVSIPYDTPAGSQT